MALDGPSSPGQPLTCPLRQGPSRGTRPKLALLSGHLLSDSARLVPATCSLHHQGPMAGDGHSPHPPAPRDALKQDSALAQTLCPATGSAPSQAISPLHLPWALPVGHRQRANSEQFAHV